MGWGRTVMITNASSSAADFDETLHALRYAAIAKEITINSRINSWRPTTFTHTLTVAKKKLGSRLQFELPVLESPEQEEVGEVEDKDEKDAEIDILLDEIYALKSQMVDAEGRVAMVETSVRAEVCAEMEAQLNSMDREWMERVAQTKASLNKKFETKMKLFQQQLQSRLDDNGQAAVDAVLEAERRTQQIVTEVLFSHNLLKYAITSAPRPFRQL
jgi:kinesin family protein 20